MFHLSEGEVKLVRLSLLVFAHPRHDVFLGLVNHLSQSAVHSHQVLVQPSQSPHCLLVHGNCGNKVALLKPSREFQLWVRGGQDL